MTRLSPRAAARANTCGRRTSITPRTGEESKCRRRPVRSKTRQAMATQSKRRSKYGGSHEGGSRGSGSLGPALLASSRPLVGRRPEPDSEPAVAAETPPALTAPENIPEASPRPSEKSVCVASREGCAWSAVSSVRSRCTAARSRRVRPPLSSLRISRRMNRMTRARSSGEADASKARRRARLARTCRPDSILSSRRS
jgi:hypothetical protein